MEISSSTAKPFMSNTKSNCPLKIVSMSGRVIETKPKNFYKLLSLSSNNVKIDEIKRAYRNMALKYHPDVCHISKKEEFEKLFVQLNEAYKVLSDPIAREEYDHSLSLCDSNTHYWNTKSDDHLTRKRWEGQIYELHRQASYRAKQKASSWGTRMRAQMFC